MRSAKFPDVFTIESDSRVALRRRRMTTAGIEVLEARILLSHSAGFVIAHLSSPSLRGHAQTYQVADHLGTGAVLEQSGAAYTVASATLAAGTPVPVRQVDASASGLHIILEEGPNLRANPAAQGDFVAAAQAIESIFDNPITVVVDAEIAPLPASIIGQTSSVEYHFGADQYNSIRDLLVNASTGSEDVVTALPTAQQFNAALPTDRGNPFSVGGLTVARANLLALGVPADELQSGPDSAYNPQVKRDMSLTFNSAFPFDYNPADGISPGKIDFTGVIEHELAHGMGFISEVDTADYLMGHPTLNRTLYPSTLDLFRLLPGDGQIDFTNAPRVLVPGDVFANQVFYDGGIFNPAGITIPGLTMGDVPLSTGQWYGDGRQASHWKDANAPGGLGSVLGAMNPTATAGKPLLWTDTDTRALGLIGWNVVSKGALQGTVYRDVNHNGRQDAGEPGLPGVKVYLDENRDGVYEPWEPSAVTDGLGVYRFYNLTAGDYLVRQIPQESLAQNVTTTSIGGAGAFEHATLSTGQTMGNLDIGLCPAPLPAGWSAMDVGRVYQPGSDAYANGQFTLASGGNDIYSIGDSFHYVYQPVRGDFTMIARVADFNAANPWAKAGIMFRQSLFQNAANVFLCVTNTNGVQFTRRQTPGALTGAQVAAGIAPQWLKIIRQGDLFTAYRSDDGLLWKQVGRQSVHLGSSVTMGLAVTSQNSAVLSTADFTNVQFAAATAARRSA
ncbi:MAG TPA: NF038122 family metalloprotease [Tepidisphaeraceae bacterium]|nr:NF038122 family metalloprotease [Tepidisphaeraceae bacterium]